ncbi:MAG: serine hydrolase [Desulfotomaculales bacterium]
MPAQPDYEVLRRGMLAFVKQQPAAFGVYFADINANAVFGIDESKPFPAASTVKLPVVLYLNTLAAEGKVDWQEKVAYQPATDFQEGCGILRHHAKEGDAFSLRTLATLAITLSDNVAYRMLLRRLGLQRVAHFMRSLGGRVVFPRGQNVTTAADMGAYLWGLLHFTARHGRLGERLLDDLAHTIYHVGLPGELPKRALVAHKEGEIAGVANDVGIVFGERPYILAVLTRGWADTSAGFAAIARLARLAWDAMI